jgi:hypothetical protein
MKVKIGNKIYDSNKEPIMLILDDKDKENINAMHIDKYKYISYPDNMNYDDIRNWIDEKPLETKNEIWDSDRRKDNPHHHTNRLD